jgi:STE20-related kinase adapter protein alpha
MTACELANGVVPFLDMPTTLMLTEKVRGCAPQLLDCSTLPPLYDEDGGQQSALHGIGNFTAHNNIGCSFPYHRFIIIHSIYDKYNHMFIIKR